MKSEYETTVLVKNPYKMADLVKSAYKTANLVKSTYGRPILLNTAYITRGMTAKLYCIDSVTYQIIAYISDDPILFPFCCKQLKAAERWNKCQKAVFDTFGGSYFYLNFFLRLLLFV